MNPVKIFDGSFGGEALWENPDYVSPSKYRQMLKKKAKDRYVNKLEQKVNYALTKPKTSYALNDTDDMFGEDEMAKATEILGKPHTAGRRRMILLGECDEEVHIIVMVFVLEKNKKSAEARNGHSVPLNDDDAEEENAKRKERKQLVKVKKLIKRKKTVAAAQVEKSSGTKSQKKPLKQQNRMKKQKMKWMQMM